MINKNNNNDNNNLDHDFKGTCFRCFDTGHFYTTWNARQKTPSMKQGFKNLMEVQEIKEIKEQAFINYHHVIIIYYMLD